MFAHDACLLCLAYLRRVLKGTSINLKGAVRADPSLGSVQGKAKGSASKYKGLALPDRKSTRLNSSHVSQSRMPSSA